MSKKEYLFGFIAIFVIVFSFYLYTVAPSMSFWDCAEYIACAYSLGVPHPPGGPLHVLVRKIFTLIPFGQEIGFRSNVASILSGALGAAIIWFLIVKIIERSKKIESKKEKIIAWFSGSVGAFIVAFSYTYWWNSVESEAYGISTFIFILCLFLIFKWDACLTARQEGLNSSTNGKDYKKYLLLIAYILALSSGIHLIPLLAAPGILLFVFLRNREKLRDQSLLRFIALVIPFFALCAGAPLILVGLITIGVIIFIFLPHRNRDSKFLALTALLLILGFTTYSYLIIRARQNPGINETAPTDINRLWDSFTRKQYGPNKLGTVFTRETAKETGYNFFHAYWEQIKFMTTYLIWQWGPWPREVRWEKLTVSNFAKFGSIAISTIFIWLGLFGVWTHYKREKKTFWLLFVTLFMVTIAFVFYMNFKFSPSNPNSFHNPREVRERHYFFGQTFALFGLYIGLGVWGFLSYVSQRTKRGWQILTPVFGILALAPIIGNFHSHVNRHGNWIPDDYGYNMLSSCDKKATVFTNGDNDTFPLWFAQEVKHTKPTVNVANLSLLNTEWYIKQMKQRGVPISFTDYEAENLMPFPVIKNGEIDRNKILLIKDFAVRDILAINGGYEFQRKIFMPIKRETLPKEYRARFPKDMQIIPPSYYARRLPKKYWLRLPEEYFLPAKEFAELVLKDYKPKTPVYFAVTVSRDNTEGFESYLKMEGLVRRVTSCGEQFDIERTDSLLNKVYRYRSIFDPRVYKHENAKKLLTNYAAAYFALGMAYRNKGEINKAIESLEQGKRFKAGQVLPFAYQLAILYKALGEHKKAEANLLELPEEARGAPAWYTLGEFYQKGGDAEKAEDAFKKAVESNPKDPSGYAGLIELYHTRRNTTDLNEIFKKCSLDPALTGKIVSLLRFTNRTKLAALVLENWLSYHPQDTIARGLLNQIRERE